jgi:Zn-dependent metalloprotease
MKFRLSRVFLFDADNGRIVFNYNLAPNAINRKIWDSNFSSDPTDEKKIDDDDLETYPYPCDVQDANLVYVDVNEVYDFYKEHHSWLSYDGNDANTILVSVRYCDQNDCDWDDAKWSAGRLYFDADYVLFDVVAHEYTHGVTENTSNLTYGATESGAINESFSDMWAAWIEGDWTIAEDDPNYGPWRNMENPHDPNAYSPGPEYLYETGYWDPDGEPHTNCSVGNYLCYLITSDLGTDDAADLFWECQHNLLQTSSDYNDLGCYLQLAAVNVDLTWSQRQDVAQACETVQIYDGGIAFEIKDNSGKLVAWFDDLGNLILTGTFTSGGTCTAPSGSFIIKNSVGEGETVAYINSVGNMCIEGGLHENQETLTPPWLY